jgi:hypothetical protein
MSIKNITYLDQILENRLFIFNNPSIEWLHFSDYIEIKSFLDSLEIDKTYVITFDFIISWLSYDEDSPVINLSKPILITKNSNPRLIADFIKSRIILACENYYLDDSIIDKDGLGVIVKYDQINLF